MIVFIENSNYLSDLVYNLSQIGYIIKWVDNLSDAVYIIENDPTVILFEAVILDLNMPTKGLPTYAMEDAKNIFPGWAFYKHILCKMPDLQKKTIFFTGFADVLKNHIPPKEFESLHIIHKDDIEQTNKFIKYFDKFGIKRSAEFNERHEN